MIEDAREAAQGEWVERLARGGLVAKGLLYGLVGALAARVALGYGGEPEDRAGALRTIAQDRLGRAMVVAIAFGLAAYATWRFAQAFFDRADVGNGAKGLAKRAGYLARGGWYVALAGLAVSVLVGRGESARATEKEATAGVLEQPLGRWVVLGVGLGILGAGLYSGFRAASGKYWKDVRKRRMNRAGRRWFDVVGVFGHVARGVVFVLMGAFLARAAYEYDPNEAIGLDGALQKLAQQWHGQLWLGVTALGLVAYALFCFVQARHRDV
jgi:hypothetical protein